MSRPISAVSCGRMFAASSRRMSANPMMPDKGLSSSWGNIMLMLLRSFFAFSSATRRRSSALRNRPPTNAFNSSSSKGFGR